jgi:shikimate dehydrogenase
MPVHERRAAVLGHPVAHSLSPVLHTAAYRALGLDGWEYGMHDVTEGALEGFLRDVDAGWAGLSLTMPLKQVVIPLLDHVDPLAEAVGAVNTVLFSAVGGAGRGTGRSAGRDAVITTGTNTDVHGLVAALREGLGARGVAEAVILGGGATAASALAAVAELGCVSPRVFVRSLDRIGPLREAVARMGVSPSFEVFDERATTSALAAADAVVSTTPKYAADQWAPLLTELLTTAGEKPRGVLLDVVYDPRPTALQSAWSALGADAVGGERMLLHQAADQVRLMTGRTAPLDAMDHALRAALTDRAR